jgi:DNA replicative helicase MCM subunit Mcm2 (Cdc46/Mcm family)
MCHENYQSIEIDFNHFKEVNSTMASWLAFNPIRFIPEINTILYVHACKRHPFFKSIIPECFVKFYGVPVTDKIRELSYQDLGKLIRSNFTVI